VNRGWVKLWRKILDSQAFQSEGLLKVWIWCLAKASHKEEWFPVKTGRGTTQVRVGPGQFIFGRFKAAKELKMTPSTVRNRMALLARAGNVDIKADRHYSVVTICNWETYNPAGDEKGQAKGQTEDNQRTTKGHIQEVQEDQALEKEKKSAPAGAAVPADLLELIGGWNTLGPGIVKKGNGASLSPSKAVLTGWRRVQKEPELRESLKDIPAILAAILKARFCHQQGWFTLPWIFAKNKSREWNLERLLAGAHERSQDGRRGAAESRNNTGTLRPGENREGGI
jgi:hypothetical protein